ncbi:MAG TPA: helix-turn-helix domain-containing protein, partial [Ilumatobacteraceae bacterium]|nr:helix-turn-helix domain-containing protein [Ilumatobacteraceae bacterium]
MGVNDRILDATKVCCERYGIAKVSIDDIAAEAGVTRATLYRLFPGGKDVVFDEFFNRIQTALVGADTLEDLLVGAVVAATNDLRNDHHLAIMLMSEPGETLANLTVTGMPRIIRMATLFLSPLVGAHLDRPHATRVVDVLARLVISYFLAPSDDVDLGD